MKRGAGHRGITLVELMAAVAITGIIVVALMRFFSKITPYMKRTQMRQQVQVQGRNCMDTIVQFLRYGKAKTVVITTPAGSPVVPNSQIDFDTVSPMPSGASHFRIYLANGTVYMTEGTRAPRPLASNVSWLMFAGNSNDPAILNVSLSLEARWDATNDPTHTSSMLMPTQEVHLSEAR